MHENFLEVASPVETCRAMTLRAERREGGRCEGVGQTRGRIPFHRAYAPDHKVRLDPGVPCNPREGFWASLKH